MDKWKLNWLRKIDLCGETGLTPSRRHSFHLQKLVRDGYVRLDAFKAVRRRAVITAHLTDKGRGELK